ncbi:hypothetical protein Sta7437_2833 [Stanieria cyanosphaera PCC 7437]|uniref:Uncharacterized protein n=1 Tax=Stanieria cyanosphaera (strain ATCC 29371 / PCC 7437) TaxID=111780 RepID=K9XWA8_STAC7|nr:hypothetical protein [Stanieria cyanosphaera]AFZ36354.1 hypothetical protein Sta7437_2833 [Stanieria cyanosphaera PCC 7437]
MKDQYNSNLRKKIKLTKPEELYQIKDEKGQIIDYEKAHGRSLFNHYRHNMTNYDEILDGIRQEQGYVSGKQEKEAVIGTAEKILEQYRNEHVKVIQDSQKKGTVLKMLLTKAKVSTTTALANLLDQWSDKIKEIGKLENSQRSLQIWNDTYRVQRELIKQLLIKEEVSSELVKQINEIYSTRSVNKAIEKGCNLFNLEKSEILKLVKSAIRYAKLSEEN